MENEKFINEYNMKLRKYNEKLNEIYRDLENEGIVILSDLKIEMESEILNKLNMNKRVMNIMLRDYILNIMLDGIKGEK